jgi:hypothetical protein
MQSTFAQITAAVGQTVPADPTGRVRLLRCGQRWPRLSRPCIISDGAQ